MRRINDNLPSGQSIFWVVQLFKELKEIRQSVSFISDQQSDKNSGVIAKGGLCEACKKVDAKCHYKLPKGRFHFRNKLPRRRHESE